MCYCKQVFKNMYSWSLFSWWECTSSDFKFYHCKGTFFSSSVLALHLYFMFFLHLFPLLISVCVANDKLHMSGTFLKATEMSIPLVPFFKRAPATTQVWESRVHRSRHIEWLDLINLFATHFFFNPLVVRFVVSLRSIIEGHNLFGSYGYKRSEPMPPKLRAVMGLSGIA